MTALTSFEADNVRAVLLRIENVPLGDDHTVYVDGWDEAAALFHGERRLGGQGTTYVWLESDVGLNEAISYKVAETTAYSFSLDIPAEWRPTFSTRDGRVIWKVGVIISPACCSDVRAFHEIIVHTAEPQIADILTAAPPGLL